VVGATQPVDGDDVFLRRAGRLRGLDEPFYAAFLAASGSAHPMADAVMAAHDTDPARVAEACAAPPPDGHAHLYMKHMPHHMLPGFRWIGPRAACMRT
jgi:hypothetical protein